MKHNPGLINALQSTTDQLINCVESLSPEQYTRRLKVFSGGTIGQHIRHITEYFQILADGLSTGEMSYDRRKRNPLFEADPSSVISVIRESTGRLAAADLSRELSLVADFDTVSRGSAVLPTTVEREIMYTLEHAIHHMAIIRMGILQEFSEIALHPDFGLAYSTIRYRAQS